MENKRKANGSVAPSGADVDDRAAKRRKASGDFDLLKGETSESTTHYGLAFLEQMRRTTDKSGRRIATYFEKLLPKADNGDYYKQTRMPISLEGIEQKLNNHEFVDLSELESYVKRMVQNAKDYYDKKTELYDDAERVRKTLSNFMTKNNPAYKLVPGYSAVPTPLPEELEEDEDAEAEEDAEGGGEEEVEVEEEAEEDEEGGGDEEEQQEEPQEEEAAEDDSEEDTSRSAAKRGRRGSRRSGRSPKKPAAPVPKPTEKPAEEPAEKPANTQPDHQYEDIPYKGLSFQQAQEKIVEEMLRRPDEEDDAYAYFEAFINLPPRSLKDYYQVIKEPLSLRKLQKLVKGIHGRGDKGGVSDYKSWAAFEEASSLLWQNAYYYNEDGSEIALMAKELEDFFFDQLKEAKAVVPEPSQPKIRIKTSSVQDTPPAAVPKRITIHVANTRGNSAESPAPATAGEPATSEAPLGGPNGVRALSVSQNAIPPLSAISPEKARSVSLTGASPSPSVAMKPEDSAGRSPAVNGAVSTPNGVHPAGPDGQQTPTASTPNGQPPVPIQLGPAYDSKFRVEGRGISEALIPDIVLRTNPSIPMDRRFHFRVSAHPKEAQQSMTVNIPANHWKIQVIPTVAAFLEQNRPYKLYVIVNGIVLPRGVPVPNDPIEPGGQLFEAQLVPGVNTIQVQIIAALPKGEKLANGSDVELEKFTILANMLRY